MEEELKSELATQINESELPSEDYVPRSIAVGGVKQKKLTRSPDRICLEQQIQK